MTKSDFAAYVFYVNRPELLRRAVDSFPDTWSNLTVVDNSGSGEIDCYCPNPVELFWPPAPLTYAQSMNWMLKDALDKKVDFILHFHSDAMSTNPAAVSQLLAYARDLRDNQPSRKWYCAWTYYDILWAINPVALKSIGGWDTNLPDYYGDNDARHRALLAGWECIDTHIEGMSHEGSATINSDPKLRFIHQQTFPLHRQYYIAKWGGGPGEEQFSVPFNRPDIFGEGSK